MAKVVGDELMTRYVIGFEVAGLLLTAALVGAIAVAHREEDDPGSRRRRPAEQPTRRTRALRRASRRPPRPPRPSIEPRGRRPDPSLTALPANRLTDVIDGTGLRD